MNAHSGWPTGARRTNLSFLNFRFADVVVWPLLAAFVPLYCTGPFIQTGRQALLPGGILLFASYITVVALLLVRRIHFGALAFIVLSVYLTFDLLYSIGLGNDPYETVRSVIPFIWYAGAGLVLLIASRRSQRYFMMAVLFYGLATAIQIVPFLLHYGSNALSSARFTSYSVNSHTPIILISIPLCFFLIKPRPARWASLLLLAAAIILTKSKGQIIISVFLVPLSVLYLGDRTDRWGLVALAVALFFVLLSVHQHQVMSSLRLSPSGFQGATTLHRLAEIKCSANVFMRYPLLGAGAGEMFSFYSPVTHTVVNQNYVHNIIAYLLSKHGLIGVALYLLPIVYAFRRFNRGGIVSKTVALSVMGFLAYGLVSASFKSIQANIFLGGLLAVAMSGKETIGANDDRANGCS